MEFVDIAGLVKGASKGEGLGNKFLSNIREVDAIAHVIRCFEDKNISHVHNKIDPEYDIENWKWITSFWYSTNWKNNFNLKKLIKAGKKDHINELNLFEKLLHDLQLGKGEQFTNYMPDEKSIINKNGILSFKPVMYVANTDELATNKDNIFNQKLISISKKYSTGNYICKNWRRTFCNKKWERKKWINE